MVTHSLSTPEFTIELQISEVTPFVRTVSFQKIVIRGLDVTNSVKKIVFISRDSESVFGDLQLQKNLSILDAYHITTMFDSLVNPYSQRQLEITIDGAVFRVSRGAVHTVSLFDD